MKFDRALQLAESLPAARRLVTMDLRSDGVTRQRVLAAAFRMLDSGSLRVGSERYTNENGSHGLATLLCAHVHVRKDRLQLSFPAKSGKTWESEITDADLAALVRVLKRRGGNARLLAYKEGRTWHPLTSADINGYVKERTGSDFTAKDFRTLRGTAAAAVSLAQGGPQKTVAARKGVISTAMQDAAAVLGNTPSIARKSYVDPRLLDHFSAGETIDPKRLDSVESELRALLYAEGDVVALRSSGSRRLTADARPLRPAADAPRHGFTAESRGQLELKTARPDDRAQSPVPEGLQVSNSAESAAKRPLRVAIVGAGPAGVYAADILTKSNEVKDGDFEVSIDLFEAYPAPYGLIRYGVAPDHPASRASSTRCTRCWTAATSASWATSPTAGTSPCTISAPSTTP